VGGIAGPRARARVSGAARRADASNSAVPPTTQPRIGTLGAAVVVTSPAVPAMSCLARYL